MPRGRRIKGLVALLLGVVTILPTSPLEQKAYAHVLSPPPAPFATRSYYAQTVNRDFFYEVGCAQIRRYRDAGLGWGIIILYFGQPRYQNGAYGTLLLDDVTFASTAQIKDAVQELARGIWDCVPTLTPRIRLAIGTSNYGSGTTWHHGQAWAQMVNEIAAYVRPRWGSQIDVAGGSDIEVDWNSWGSTLNWIGGYDSINNHIYYDFGDAGGCYPYHPPGQYDTCQTEHQSWRRENVWYKSFGSGIARTIPQIYYGNPTQAGQWQKMSLYSYINHQQRPIIFAGSLTQWEACQTNPPCPGTNTPSAGWTQLWDKLNNNDPPGHNYYCQNPPNCHRTNQANIGWASDMSWALRR